MNEQDFQAFLNYDEILDGFIKAILFYKADALVYGKYGINHGCRAELKEYYYYVADSWIRNYFEMYSENDVESFIREIKKMGTVRKTAPQVYHHKHS